MKKRLQLIAVFVMASTFSFAQNIQNSTWCFGYHAQMTFNPNPSAGVSAATFPGSGNASVSDENGQLLFYTNGRTVWNKNHAVMTNGTGLYGGNGASPQTAIIVPKPGSDVLYYIFTGSGGDGNFPFNNQEGLYYSVVDMTTCDGEVVSGLKNIPLKNESGDPIVYDVSTEVGLKTAHIKATTVLKQGGDGIWAVFFLRFGEWPSYERVVYSYLINEDGINSTADGVSPEPTASSPISNSNYPGGDGVDWFGQIKVSPNGEFLCDAAADAVNLYDFDDLTGEAEFNTTVYLGVLYVSNPGYGVEFSPNSERLYFSTFDNTIIQEEKDSVESNVKIYQYEIATSKMDSIGTFAVDNELTTPLPANNPGTLQLAIDGRIFVSMQTITPTGTSFQYLGIIQLPDEPFEDCDFDPSAFGLANGTEHWFNLPQWVYKIRSVWPKVYYSDKYVQLHKGKNNNIFLDLRIYDMDPNVNHAGPEPVLLGNPHGDPVTIQYSNTSAIARWANTDQEIDYVLNSGDIYSGTNFTSGFSYQYLSACSGQPITPPTIAAPSGHKILAEMPSGYLITSKYWSFAPPTSPYTEIYIRDATSTVASVQTGEDPIVCTKFNPVSKRFYIFRFYNHDVLIYDLSANTFSYVGNIVLNNYDRIVQVDNDDNIYVLHDGAIEIIDATGSYTTVEILGFPNDNIIAFYSNNEPSMNDAYTGDQCLVGRTSDESIYALDLNLLTEKKITTTNLLDATNATWTEDFTDYLIIEDNVFLAGAIYGTNQPYIEIGNQQIDFLGVGTFSSYLTKFSLDTDFSRQVENSVEAPPLPTDQFTFTVSPNPASGEIRMMTGFLVKGGRQQEYSLLIIDQVNNIVLRKEKYQPGTVVNIEALKAGIYFVQLTSAKGERSTRKMIKL